MVRDPRTQNNNVEPGPGPGPTRPNKLVSFGDTHRLQQSSRAMPRCSRPFPWQKLRASTSSPPRVCTCRVPAVSVHCLPLPQGTQAVAVAAAGRSLSAYKHCQLRSLPARLSPSWVSQLKMQCSHPWMASQRLLRCGFLAAAATTRGGGSGGGYSGGGISGGDGSGCRLGREASLGMGRQGVKQRGSARAARVDRAWRQQMRRRSAAARVHAARQARRG